MRFRMNDSRLNGKSASGASSTLMPRCSSVPISWSIWPQSGSPKGEDIAEQPQPGCPAGLFVEHDEVSMAGGFTGDLLQLRDQSLKLSGGGEVAEIEDDPSGPEITKHLLAGRIEDRPGNSDNHGLTEMVS